MIFSGPAPSVTASLNFRLKGTVSEQSSTDVLGVGPGLVVTIGLGYASQAILAANGSVNTTGLFTSVADPLNVNGTFTTPGFVVPTGEPVNFQVELLGSNVQQGIGSGLATVDYYADGFSLPSSGPVFNLPAGYSADAPDLGIVSNGYIGPPPSVPALGLPAQVFLALAFVAAGGRSLRRAVVKTRAHQA